jgi:hypothetical protein
VKRLVEERNASSYKEVASMLIEEMRKNNKLDEIYGDESHSSVNDEVTPGKTDRKSRLSSVFMSKEKKEKNVKRRVYDALNVLKAANVLIEN